MNKHLKRASDKLIQNRNSQIIITGGGDELKAEIEGEIKENKDYYLILPYIEKYLYYRSMYEKDVEVKYVIKDLNVKIYVNNEIAFKKDNCELDIIKIPKEYNRDVYPVGEEFNRRGIYAKH